jgi:hypothetical protein
MQNLEQWTQQLLHDWQALRRELEHFRLDHRGDPFDHAQLDAIEASILALPAIVHGIAHSPAASAGGETRACMGQRAAAPHDRPAPGGPRTEGLGAHLRRIRQAEEAGEELPWHRPSAGGP